MILMIISFLLISTIICLEETIYNSTIIFSNDKINITGEGVYESSKGVITINNPGSYLIKGTSNEGNIIIVKSSVYLYLENFELSSSKNSPILVDRRLDDVRIIAIQNVTLNDLEDLESKAECATIKIKKKSNVTIQSLNDLKLTGKSKNVIKGVEQVSITFQSPKDGVFIIEAQKNAIACDNLLIFKGGIFNITTKTGDAINADSDDSDINNLGKIIIEKSEFHIESYNDAFQAKSLIEINDGSFYIKTENGSQSTTFNRSSDSANAFKVSGKDAGSEIMVYNGTFFLDTPDNTFHSNGNLTLTNGNYNINSKRNGLHAKFNVVIGKNQSSIGPNINILNSDEAIEGMSIIIYSGNLYTESIDDGINAAGGAENKEIINPNNIISIYGGEIYIFSNGDGLDSNGNLFIYGGDINIFSKETGEKSPIDCGGNFTIFSTTILGVGSKGMKYIHEGIKNGNQLYAYYKENINKTKILQILNEKDEIIKEGNITKNIDYIFYTSPKLNFNYTLKIFNPDGSNEEKFKFSFGNSTIEINNENPRKSKKYILFIIIFPLLIIIILIILLKRYYAKKKHDQLILDSINKELSRRESLERDTV